MSYANAKSLPRNNCPGTGTGEVTTLPAFTNEITNQQTFSASEPASSKARERRHGGTISSERNAAGDKMQMQVQPPDFRKLGCGECIRGADLDFEFSMAFQPIINTSTRKIFAHEALVRGPNGESAGSVFESLAEVTIPETTSS